MSILHDSPTKSGYYGVFTDRLSATRGEAMNLAALHLAIVTHTPCLIQYVTEPGDDLNAPQATEVYGIPRMFCTGGTTNLQHGAITDETELWVTPISVPERLRELGIPGYLSEQFIDLGSIVYVYLDLPKKGGLMSPDVLDELVRSVRDPA